MNIMASAHGHASEPIAVIVLHPDCLIFADFARREHFGRCETTLEATQGQKLSQYPTDAT